jgi:hypothetical protein
VMREQFAIGIFALSCVALIVVLVRYIWVPLWFRRNFTLALNSEVRPLDGSVRLPAQVEEYFRRAESPLKSRGFEWLGDRAHTGLTDRVASSSRMFVNREKRGMASIAVSYLKNRDGAWEIKHTITVFRTDFTNGTTVSTSNIPVFQLWPRGPNSQAQRFANIRDPALLHEVHEAIIERSCAGNMKELLLDSQFKGDWLAFARYQVSEKPKKLVGTGYYWLDESRDALRPTLKGAFILVCKQSWPWKQLRERWHERAATRVLRELGRDEQGRPRVAP